MKINQNNLNSMMNVLGVEQAARKAAHEKTAEAARAHAAEEALRLREISDSLKENKEGRKKDSGSGQGRRNARYLPDGSVQPEGPDAPPGRDAAPPPHKGIDLKA